MVVLLSLISGCANLPQHPGGQIFVQPGVSFTPPAGSQWSILSLSTYQTALITKGKNDNESYIVATQLFQIPPFESNDAFLNYVQKGRASEPQTGRFETIKNEEALYKQREETCVKHRASSKDYGAKRGGEYAIYETYGMNCIHPKNSQVGVFIELSRKAPAGIANDEFDRLGENLLKSVQFTDFR
jgi:hypothetical protein